MFFFSYIEAVLNVIKWSDVFGLHVFVTSIPPRLTPSLTQTSTFAVLLFHLQSTRHVL